jgi:hypothetical protein
MAEIRVGKPDVDPHAPAHTPGVRQGNDPGAYAKQVGHKPDGRVTAERSTGVNAKARNPIDPRMPNLPPA